MRAPLVGYCADEVLSANLPAETALRWRIAEDVGNQINTASAAHLGESLAGKPKSRSPAHTRAHAVGVGHSKKPYLRERS